MSAPELSVLGEGGPLTEDLDEADTSSTQLLLRFVALIAVVVGGWITLTAWFAVVAPPGLVNLVPVAVLASAAWVVVLWLGSRTQWFVGLARRFAISIIGFSACYFFVVTFLLSPMTDDLVLWVVPYLLVFSAAVVALIGGLVRLRRQRPDAILALVSVLLFTVLLRSNHTSWYDLGRQGRVRLVADRYEAEARDVLADPPPSGRPTGDRIFFPAKSGSGGVVGWIWIHGIPAKASGVAYDPDGLGRDGVLGAGEYDYGGYPCQHIDGPWYWCRFT